MYELLEEHETQDSEDVITNEEGQEIIQEAFNSLSELEKKELLIVIEELSKELAKI